VKQQPVNDPWMQLDPAVKRVWQGEYDMMVSDWQYLCLLALTPLLALPILALWAVPVPTSVILLR
jgi:hypothetical protein